mmetsp:Transcript_9211/g.27731  ORF Transcript_9211/g.27731 Transcript_9211/m.27731 type:complete len:220 (-) Transcript_9211:71-730(-)
MIIALTCGFNLIIAVLRCVTFVLSASQLILDNFCFLFRIELVASDIFGCWWPDPSLDIAQADTYMKWQLSKCSVQYLQVDGKHIVCVSSLCHTLSLDGHYLCSFRQLFHIISVIAELILVFPFRISLRIVPDSSRRLLTYILRRFLFFVSSLLGPAAPFSPSTTPLSTSSSPPRRRELLKHRLIWHSSQQICSSPTSPSFNPTKPSSHSRLAITQTNKR